MNISQGNRIALITHQAELTEDIRQVIPKSGKWKFEVYQNVGAFGTSSLPDITVVDCTSSQSFGIDQARELKLAFPNAKTMLAARFANGTTVLSAVMLGIRGFIIYPFNRKQFMNAVQEVVQGRQAFCAQSVEALLDGLSHARGECGEFSTRELEIVGYILGRRSDKEIAQAMGIGTGTVHSHLSRIYKKLDAHNRYEVISKLAALNLPASPSPTNAQGMGFR